MRLVIVFIAFIGTIFALATIDMHGEPVDFIGLGFLAIALYAAVLDIVEIMIKERGSRKNENRNP